MDRAMDDRNKHNQDSKQNSTDFDHEGREQYEMDIDRMLNEGLAGGYVSDQNGHIGDTSTDFM